MSKTNSLQKKQETGINKYNSKVITSLIKDNILKLHHTYVYKTEFIHLIKLQVV